MHVPLGDFLDVGGGLSSSLGLLLDACMALPPSSLLLLLASIALSACLVMGAAAINSHARTLRSHMHHGGCPMAARAFCSIVVVDMFRPFWASDPLTPPP